MYFKIYEFKNLQVKSATFNSDDVVKRDLKLVFDNSSEVNLLPEDTNFACLDYKFESLDCIMSNTFQRVNLLAVVNSIGEIESGTAASGRFWCKRNLNIQDPSVEEGINLQVWGPDVSFLIIFNCLLTLAVSNILYFYKGLFEFRTR
jgi:hypothetical protein